MRLNDLRPGAGARRARKRVGRGTSSGHGKTCGRGHKGQRSRKSPDVPAGFEGGQMPIARRLPKFGFKSRVARMTAEVRTDALAKVQGEIVDLDSLRAARLVGSGIRRVKVIAAGELERAVVVKGLGVTRGARAIIEGAGGRVEA